MSSHGKPSMVRDMIPSDVQVLLTNDDLELFQLLHTVVNEGPEDDFCVVVSSKLLDLINRYEMAVCRQLLKDSHEAQQI